MKKFIKIILASFALCTVSVVSASADPFETKMGVGFWGQFGFAAPFCGMQLQAWPINRIGLAVTGSALSFGDFGYYSVAGDVDVLIFKNAFNENNGIRMYIFGQVAYNRFDYSNDDDDEVIIEYAGGIGAEFVFGKHFGLPLQFGYSYATEKDNNDDDALIGAVVGIGARFRF